jgi:hypothetical protein
MQRSRGSRFVTHGVEARPRRPAPVPKPVMSPWRQILRAAKAARDAAHLGPRAAAGAAAVELNGTGWDVRAKARAILASQAAKNVFATNLRELDRLLEEHDAFVQEMQSRPKPRRIPWQLSPDRRDPLPVEAARAVPIGDVFKRYGFDLRRAGGNLVARCPFHEDRRPSLRVSPGKGLWHCFPCGAGGDGIALVMRLRGLDFTGAVRELAS